MHEMKIRDDKSDSQEDSMKYSEPIAVSGSGTETGQKIGQEKKTLTYMAERVVGWGSSGVVFEAKCLQTGESVAIKKMLQDQTYENGELQIMHLLDHPNVVQMKDCFYTSEKNEVYLNLVLEYVSETFDHYKGMHHRMPIFYVKLYTYQIIRALNYLHNVIGVCHRDILPQNLLVNPRTGQLKICDFGSAKKLVPDEPNISNMRPWRYTIPMGIFGEEAYPTEIDMRSAGLVMAELLIGPPLFAMISHVDQLVEIIKVFHERTCPEAVELVLKLLLYSPWLNGNAGNALELCAHRFFDSLREPNACLLDGRSLPLFF